MKKVIKNNYKIIIAFVLGICVSVTSVYAVDAYIESNKVSYDNKYTDKNNVQASIDELYKRSGIHKEKWIDSTLNGADPVLKDSLIPVEIKPNGEVYYANLNSEWYNYSEKRWANAVILNDNVNYKVGDHILDSDIKGYFVWIPRYQYKVWNMGEYSSTLSLKDLKDSAADATSEGALWRVTGNSTRIIDIKFGSVEKTPKMNESGASLNNYYTHPAFTLGEKDLNGIWVGKFETGGSASNVLVKPNITSWRNQTVKEFFTAGKSFAEDLDSHMMKNTEWGAVAYLSHSEYGIGNEVNINNASDYYTGYSAASNTDQSSFQGETGVHTDETKTQPWNTPVGYLANTTGNISGIYDMSGGAYEYVAAYRKDSTSTDKSGFDANEITNQISNGYIDGYDANSSINSYNKRILGDATGEMGPFYKYFERNGTSHSHSSWYSDTAYFIDLTHPWADRGSHWSDANLAGLFCFHMYAGGTNPEIGFRLVLAPH